MQLYFNDTDPEALEKAETLLFNGNGFLGVRGCLEEFRYQDFRSNRETYINGFYEMHDISYPESMHGMPREGETMIGVIDGQTSEILIGGEQLTMDSGTISEYSRFVDMSKGGTFRSFLWTSPKESRQKSRFPAVSPLSIKICSRLTLSLNGWITTRRSLSKPILMPDLIKQPTKMTQE